MSIARALPGRCTFGSRAAHNGIDFRTATCRASLIWPRRGPILWRPRGQRRAGVVAPASHSPGFSRASSDMTNDTQGPGQAAKPARAATGTDTPMTRVNAPSTP